MILSCCHIHDYDTNKCSKSARMTVNNCGGKVLYFLASNEIHIFKNNMLLLGGFLTRKLMLRRKLKFYVNISWA